MRLALKLCVLLVAFVGVGLPAARAEPSAPAVQTAAAPTASSAVPPVSAPAAEPTLPSRNPYMAIVAREARAYGVPAVVVDAVMRVESGYNPAAVGGVGEIGLMQVRPETAAMLGFRGTDADLALPETNIQFGVRYLAKAWRLAGGDLCRALVKYRAGHGEERETPLSTEYCRRARAYLIGLDPAAVSQAKASVAPPRARKNLSTAIPTAPRARVMRSAFWAAHEARVQRIRATVRAKWASRARFASRR